MGLRIAALVFATISLTASAQTAAPSFAVTSVKPSRGESKSFGISFDGGRASLTNITVADMLRGCYGLTTNDQLPGLPEWAKNDRWDINATEEEPVARRLETGPLEQRIQLMHALILELLHDRFGLHETKSNRVLHAYALTVAKSGATVKATGAMDKATFHGLDGGNGHIVAHGAPMSLLVMRLSVVPEVQDHPIVDQTGMTGEYDWTLNWTPELSAPNPEATDAPDLFEALQQQLGLRLLPTKTGVPAIQIDSISKPAVD